MIIFINGTINSGKTTVAKILAQKIPNTANVEIDNLRNFIPWLEISKAISINLENALSVINNFAQHGYNVIVPYPLSQENYEFFKSKLDDYAKELFFITLAPDMNKILANTDDRKLTQWERDRIKYHYDIGIQKPSFGKIIDNTKQTPEETAEEIFTILKKG